MTERRGGVKTPLRLLRETLGRKLSRRLQPPAGDPATMSAQPLAALGIALGVVLLSGPATIRFLTRRCRESIRRDSPHLASLSAGKSATPSMGGLLILGGFLVPVCFFTKFSPPILAAIGLSIGLAALGIYDDLAKRRSPRRGISARTKLAGQCLIAAIVILWLAWHDEIAAQPVSIPLAMLVIAGMSNAVNLADGLDGLASGCSLLVLVPFAMLATSDDLLVIIASLAGALLGFLWFNRHPARVFMGDTGSLPLGGLLGLLIVLLGPTLPLLVVCGVFLIEITSVVLQVGCYRWTGRRVFLCAPLHHHFQFLGWPERRIVWRFWLAGAVCTLAGLSLTRLTPAWFH